MPSRKPHREALWTERYSVWTDHSTPETQVLGQLRASGAPERWCALVEQVQELSAEDQQRSLGDSLPPGLVLLG